MNLLVTGGCGFIGSNFVRHLLQTDPAIRVINFDALTYAGNLANLTDLADDPRYTFIRGDITDRTAVRAAMDVGIEMTEVHEAVARDLRNWKKSA